MLAAITMTDPMTMRCRSLEIVACMMPSIRQTVVRLSRLADIMNVSPARIHRKRVGLCVRSHSLIKSKQPLLLSTSTMVIVPKMKSTTSAAFTIYLKKMDLAMNVLTEKSLTALLDRKERKSI